MDGRAAAFQAGPLRGSNSVKSGDGLVVVEVGGHEKKEKKIMFKLELIRSGVGHGWGGNQN